MRRSLIFGLLFAIVLVALGEGVSLLLDRLGVPWIVAALDENVITGLAAGGLVFLYLEERRRNVEIRVEELAYLNHHIRNALTAITLAPYAPNDDMRLRMIRDASDRIQKTIEKLSAQEQVSLRDSEDTTKP